MAKLEKYKTQIAEEKNNSLNLELDISRRNAEIDILKSEKVKLEKLLIEQEARLSDADQSVQQYSIQAEEVKGAYIQGQGESNKTETKKGIDVAEVFSSIEKALEQYREEVDPNLTEEEARIELLEKENQLLKGKFKEILTQGEAFKGPLDPESSQIVEKLTLENERTKAELARVISSMDASASLDLKRLRAENAHVKEVLYLP